MTNGLKTGHTKDHFISLKIEDSKFFGTLKLSYNYIIYYMPYFNFQVTYIK